ncbi:Cysteine-rich secretory protein 1 [Apodemus speciosus]|uniref:Cysteine-rich secretory protein 1 n=1 Tax=Apodemus speciosus TaxID=105296 RepID=A0ABQ0FP69_APOSI
MALILLLLFLAAVLPPSLLQDDYESNSLEDLSTSKMSVQEEIVNKHNQLRRMVSPSGSDLLKMEWNIDAQVNAQDWADKCTYRHSPIELRTTKLKCGENLFMSNYLATWSSVIQDWYDESSDLAFGLGPKEPGSKVGHYTQVYCPGGNNINRLYTPYTKGAPCASCPGHCEDGLCTNSCEYEDEYSNCEELKSIVTCEHEILKEGCRATCNCEGKIH